MIAAINNRSGDTEIVQLLFENGGKFMKLFVARHGKTIWNEQNRIREILLTGIPAENP